MTLKEFYDKTGGQYEQVVARLMSEDRVKKYVLKFKEDDSLVKIKKALEEKAYKDAFMYTHNLKGVCLNLSFDGLLNSVSVLCEELRDGTPQADLNAMYDALEVSYIHLKSMIDILD